MNEPNYTIELKRGDLKILVSGPKKDWVEAKFEELEGKDSRFEGESKIQAPSRTSETAVHESKWESLARFAGVTLEQLDQIYDTDLSDKIRITKLTRTGSNADKQRQVTMLALIASEHVLNQKEMTGRALSPLMQDLGIKALENLSATLRKVDNIRVHKGKYKLNIPGQNEAYELIQNMVYGQE